jgi:4-amino-4-deoxy-L-arabinose transferase-like glycosyltransferase
VLSFWPYAVVLAVGIFVLLPQLGDFGFWDPWEPKYAESAREMIELDSYIVTYYREEVRLAKPILVYWGILAGSAVFGLNEFGARILGVVAALAAMAGVFYAVSQLRGRQAGLIAALVLATVPQFFFIARQAMPDVYLFTSLGMCLLFFGLGLFGPPERRDRHFIVSYVCIALAVLAKGPVIISMVVLTTLAIWTVIGIDLRELWRPGRRGPTILFASTVFPAAVLVPLLGLVAYLFGTSPIWWGYSGKSRDEAALFRGQLNDLFTRLHLADLLLVLVAGLALLAVVLLVRRGRTRRSSFWLAGAPGLWALAALGGMTAADPERKIAVASLLAVVTCVIVVVVSSRRFLRQEWLWPTLQPYLRQIGRQLLRFAVVFLVIAGPWHLAIIFQQGHGYMTDFIIKHNVHRVGETVNRSGISDFYLRTLIFGYFPWSCFIPAVLASLVGWRERNPLKRYSLEVYLMIASVVTFTAFTGATTKFAHYLSPMLVPLCVLIGLAISRTLDDRNSAASRLLWIVAAMLFLLPTMDLFDTGGYIHMIGAFTMKTWVPAGLEPGPYYKGLVVAVGVFLFASIVVRSRLLLAGLVVSATLMASYNTAFFVPQLTKHKSMKHLCDTWQSYAPSGDPPICFYGDIKHSVFFYTEGRVDRLNNREQFQRFTAPDHPAFCIVERETLPGLQRNHRSKHDGSDLQIVDGSHFKYVLIANFEIQPDPATGD